MKKISILSFLIFMAVFTLPVYCQDYETDFANVKVYIKNNEFPKAEETVKIMLQNYPDNTDLLSILARVLFWQKKYDESIEVCNKLKNIFPKDKDLILLYIEALILNSDIEKAKEEIFNLPQDLKDYIYINREDLIYRVTKNYVKPSGEFYTYIRPDKIDNEIDLNLEVSQMIKGLTFILKASDISRYSLNDTQLNLDVYSKLWNKAWGCASFSVSPDAEFLPITTFGAEIYQGYKDFEFSLGYRRMNFKDTSVDIFMPGVTVYLPYELSLNEKFYLVNGVYSLSSKLYYEPGYKFDIFYNFIIGDSTENIKSTEDIQRIFSIYNGFGAEYRITSFFSLGGEAGYESRKDLYDKYGFMLSGKYWW